MAQPQPQPSCAVAVCDRLNEGSLAEADLRQAGSGVRFGLQVAGFLCDPETLVVIRSRPPDVPAIPCKRTREAHHASFEVLEPCLPGGFEGGWDDGLRIIGSLERSEDVGERRELLRREPRVPLRSSDLQGALVVGARLVVSAELLKGFAATVEELRADARDPIRSNQFGSRGGAFIPADRLLGRVHASMPMTGEHGEARCPRRIARELGVMCHELRELLIAPAGPSLHPVKHGAMRGRAAGTRDAPIRDITGQGVLEGELRRPRDRACWPQPDQATCHQRIDRGLDVGIAELLRPGNPEGPPHDTRHLDHPLL